MNLRELQERRDLWVAKNFPDQEPIDAFLGAVEEMGELAHAILKRKQGIRGTTEEHTANVKDAVADVIIFLAGVASHEGFALGQVVEEVWESVEKRDWQANPQNGGEQLSFADDPRYREGLSNLSVGELEEERAIQSRLYQRSRARIDAVAQELTGRVQEPYRAS